MTQFGRVRLEGVVKDFKRSFTTSAGETLTKDEEPVDAIDSEAVDQETVKVRKKD